MTHPTYSLNDCTPNQQQTWLLQAAVAQGDDALKAWSKWRSHVNLDDIDPASFRLLPLVYRNLVGLQIEEDQLLARLKGVYRHNWYKNQLLFRQLQGILMQLREAAIPVMLLKGAAMTIHYYQDTGKRLMNDVDIMVPQEQFSQAANILLRNGWQTAYSSSDVMHAQHQAQLIHAAGFEKDGSQVDLHCVLLPLTCQEDAERWQKAFVQNWQGTPIHLLDITEQLFHTCVHGLRWSYAYLTWIPDALFLLHNEQANINWFDLVNLARKTRSVVFLRNALSYLADVFHAPIPARIFQELAAEPVSWTEEQEYTATSSAQTKSIISLAKYHFFRACRYQSLLNGMKQPIPLSVTGWLNYCFVMWQLKSWRQFPGILFSKLKKNALQIKKLQSFK